jgi:CheY-like chemotaxis protein
MGHTEDMHLHDPGDKELNDRDLRHTLNHLYEPEALRHSSLLQAFGLEHATDVVTSLRRLLLDAIEKMRPDDEVPLQSPVWRTYHIMVQRFVEQASQQEVANDLGLSVRQLRRHESTGLKELAGVLSTHYHAYPEHGQTESMQAAARFDVPATPRPNSARTPPPLAATSHEEELAWSQRSYPREFIRITDLIEPILETIMPLARMMDVQVSATLLPAMPRLAVQSITVRQALLSLLALAIRHVPGGRVSVTSTQETRAAIVEIAAFGREGASVPPVNDEESLEFIQTLFASSGGRFELLPSAASSHSLQARITLPCEKLMTVMVIDDNPDALQLLERYVTDTGYRVVSVREAQKSIATAEEVAPDVILIDVMMPGIDGWELMGRLRQHPKIGGTPLIICTILPQAQLALDLGASAFLRKPINRKEFLTLLDNQLNLLRR